MPAIRASNRTVAVKILPSHLSEDPESKQRFDREARTISSLNHPNICTLHDVGHQDGIDYLVMEYLEGQTLADRLSKGPLPVEQVLKYGADICDGLEKAHRGGVVHRDLKPGNIMLTRTGAKLMDFGLAKTVGCGRPRPPACTATLSHAPGKPSPHGAGHGGRDVPVHVARADRGQGGRCPFGHLRPWGGAVRNGDGKRAFEGKTAASAMAAVMEREPPPISSSAADDSARARAVDQDLPGKDPDERWQTAHDVKLQLKQIAEGGSQVTSSGGCRDSAQTNVASCLGC